MKQVGLLLFVIALCFLFMERKHLLNLFIIMELFVLSMVLMAVNLDLSHSGILMLILTLGAAEAGLSLSLVFLMMRVNGNDCLSSFVLFK